MEKLSILSQIKERDDLLSLPQALAEILREVDNPDFSSDQLARIIMKDPPLTGRILKLANSSMYRRYSGVSNVHQAVQTLGAVTVKCLALSTSVLHPDRIEKDSGIDPRTYFMMVLTVAAASEKIAETLGYKSPEDAFIAGLLHDIGTMFFLHHHPRHYRKIAAGDVRGARNVIDAERSVFEADHTEVGFHLATRWRLPEHIATAIRDHHIDPDPGPKISLAGIVRMATLLTEDADGVYRMELEERLNAITMVSSALGLEKDQIDEVSATLMASTISVAEYLGIDIGDIEEMLTRANQEIWRTYLMIENLFKERQELGQKLLQQERARGAYESKTVAMATLSHYMNNIAMAIYGRSQMMRMQLEKDKTGVLMEQLPTTLDVIDKSIQKMVAVLAEMKDISPIDEIKFLSTSKAMNIDDRIEKRMKKIDTESFLELPDEAKEPVA
jgi:putative nucleotidyltransferase with HDIG domain